MGLYEFFFPEVSAAESLSKVAEAYKRSSRVAEFETRQQQRDSSELAQAVIRLENDLGTISLVLAAILKKLEDKGQISRDELKDVLLELDLLDSVRDGKLDVEELRKGDFLTTHDPTDEK